MVDEKTVTHILLRVGWIPIDRGSLKIRCETSAEYNERAWPALDSDHALRTAFTCTSEGATISGPIGSILAVKS